MRVLDLETALRMDNNDRFQKKNIKGYDSDYDWMELDGSMYRRCTYVDCYFVKTTITSVLTERGKS